MILCTFLHDHSARTWDISDRIGPYSPPFCYSTFQWLLPLYEAQAMARHTYLHLGEFPIVGQKFFDKAIGKFPAIVGQKFFDKAKWLRNQDLNRTPAQKRKDRKIIRFERIPLPEEYRFKGDYEYRIFHNGKPIGTLEESRVPNHVGTPDKSILIQWQMYPDLKVNLGMRKGQRIMMGWRDMTCLIKHIVQNQVDCWEMSEVDIMNLAKYTRELRHNRSIMAKARRA